MAAIWVVVRLIALAIAGAGAVGAMVLAYDFAALAGGKRLKT